MRDLWTHRLAAVPPDGYEATVPAHGVVAMPSGGTATVIAATPVVFVFTVAVNRMLQPGTGRKSTDWLVPEQGGSVPGGIPGTHAFGGHGIAQPRHGQSVHTKTTIEPSGAWHDIVRFSGEAKHSGVHDVDPETRPLIV